MPRKGRQTLVKKKQSSRSPLIFVVGGLALVILAGLFAFLRQPGSQAKLQVNGRPSLQADRQRIDLGDIKLGEMTYAEFVLTNTGDSPLEFQEAPYIEVKEGC